MQGRGVAVFLPLVIVKVTAGQSSHGNMSDGDFLVWVPLERIS